MLHPMRLCLCCPKVSRCCTVKEDKPKGEYQRVTRGGRRTNDSTPRQTQQTTCASRQVGRLLFPGDRWKEKGTQLGRRNGRRNGRPREVSQGNDTETASGDPGPGGVQVRGKRPDGAVKRSRVGRAEAFPEAEEAEEEKTEEEVQHQ